MITKRFTKEWFIEKFIEDVNFINEHYEIGEKIPNYNELTTEYFVKRCDDSVTRALETGEVLEYNVITSLFGKWWGINSETNEETEDVYRWKKTF